MSNFYKSKKQEFDDLVYRYLVKRLKQPITSSDAYLSGIVDEYGNANSGLKETWAFTKLDKLIFDIKMELGDKVNLIDDDYDNVDSLLLMNGNDVSKYNDAYAGMLSLVEECMYLPAGMRGKGDYVDDDSDLSESERISRAMTIATYVLYCVKLNRIPTEVEFNNQILPATEATFDIRSIGSNDEIKDVLLKGHLINGRELTKEGYVLSIRLAKWIVAHDLCKKSVDTIDNETRNWRQLANAG